MGRGPDEGALLGCAVGGDVQLEHLGVCEAWQADAVYNSSHNAPFPMAELCWCGKNCSSIRNSSTYHVADSFDGVPLAGVSRRPTIDMVEKVLTNV